MFTEDNTNGEYTDRELDLMNTALIILMADYRGTDEDERIQYEKHFSDRILNNFRDGCTLEDLTDDGRVYAEDRDEGAVVYRIPGAQHGDGQVDSDKSPVWLLSGADWESIPDGILKQTARYLMNPHTGSVDTAENWAAEGHTQENATLIRVIRDQDGDWVEA